LTLRELGGSRRQLGRLPPLHFLQRRLRVGQLLREDVAVGELLSEPDFELTLALRSVRGGQLFGRGALFGLLPRGRGVGQPEFERLPRGGRLCERGGELRFASNESVGRGSRVCRPDLLGLVECPFGVSHLPCQRFAGRITLRSLCVVLGLTLRQLRGSRRHLERLPPLRFLQRRLRVGQLAREGIAGGEFLSEPDFELTLAL
jgi:hypothetical protein